MVSRPALGWVFSSKHYRLSNRDRTCVENRSALRLRLCWFWLLPPLSQANRPTIQVSSSAAAEGVYLLPSTHPHFELAFKLGRASGYAPLLPYTAVIENNTDEPIMAYSVVWHCRDANGRVRKPTRSVNGFSGLGKPVVGTHSTGIVSLDSALEADPSRWSDSAHTQVQHFVTLLSTDVAMLDIVLDAVAFGDRGHRGRRHRGLTSASSLDDGNMVIYNLKALYCQVPRSVR